MIHYCRSAVFTRHDGVEQGRGSKRIQVYDALARTAVWKEESVDGGNFTPGKEGEDFHVAHPPVSSEKALSS